MRLVLKFLKPHWKLCVATVLLLIIDVAGALYIPTLAAEILNEGTSGSTFETLLGTGVQMAVASLISGVCAVTGGYTCAMLSARLGKDMRTAVYEKSLKLLDRMSTVLLENITGVRVVRAFNNETREEKRMAESFSNYAETSIKANRRFANLDGLSFFCINFFVVTVYWLSGGRISAGHLQIGDITAVIEYAMMVLFFLMMAQMVILTLPRALECCERIREVLDHSPEITDMVTENPAESEKEEDRKKCLRLRMYRSDSQMRRRIHSTD